MQWWRLTPVVLIVAALARPAGAADSPTPPADYTIVSWTEKDGLPSSDIFSIEQDRDGYIWLGTEEGIVRFDGARFVTWNGLNPAPLPERRVISILSSADGSLWIAFAGSGGINRVRDRVVTNYGGLGISPADYVRALLEDRQGAIWAVSPSGLYRFSGTQWNKVGPEHGLPDGSMWNAYEDASGNLWVVAAMGLFRRNAATDTFHAVEPATDRVRGVAQDRSGAIWVTDPTIGLRSLSPSGLSRYLAQSGNKGTGSAVMSDRHGNLWVGTQAQGLWRVGSATGPDAPAIRVISMKDGLLSDQVRCLFEDRDGNIWVGTPAGLHKFSSRVIDSVTLGLTRTLAATADGTVWVGTADGLFRITRAGKAHAPEQVLKSSVYALHVDANQTLWVATEQSLVRFAEGRAAPVSSQPHAPLRHILAMASDSRGELWLCDQDYGVYRWNNGKPVAFLPLSGDGITRRGVGSAYALYMGQDDHLWIAFSDGTLGQIDAAQNDVRLFGSSGDGSLRAVIESRANAVWLGGVDGLARFLNGRFVTANRKHGLPAKVVSAVVEDRDGYIWAGVGAAIIRVDPKEFDELARTPSHQIHYRIYDGSDGVPGAPVWRRAGPNAIEGRDGRLWFVTTGGLVVLDPAAQDRESLTLRARIVGVVADDQAVDPVPGAGLPSLTRRLQIDYTAVNFVSAMKTRFRYRLDGFDEDWVNAGTRRQAFYTNLPPRQYRFRVAAATSEGTWNESTTPWDFSIQPALYQTRWFQGIVLVAFVPLLWGGWRLRGRQVRRRLSVITAERARMSREIHDSLLQSLAGVALQLEGLSQRVEPSSHGIRDHLSRIRGQIEDCIREARQSVLDLRLPTLEGRDLVGALREIGERMTSGTAMQLEFEVTGTPRRFRRTIEEQVLRIGREALHNAARHARPTCIRVELDYGPRVLLLGVTDDGIGFDADPVDGHYGLISMRERARQVGGRFTLVSSVGKGTRIEAVVPLTPASGSAPD